MSAPIVSTVSIYIFWAFTPSDSIISPALVSFPFNTAKNKCSVPTLASSFRSAICSADRTISSIRGVISHSLRSTFGISSSPSSRRYPCGLISSKTIRISIFFISFSLMMREAVPVTAARPYSRCSVPIDLVPSLAAISPALLIALSALAVNSFLTILLHSSLLSKIQIV